MTAASGKEGKWRQQAGREGGGGWWRQRGMGGALGGGSGDPSLQGHQLQGRHVPIFTILADPLAVGAGGEATTAGGAATGVGACGAVEKHWPAPFPICEEN